MRGGWLAIVALCGCNQIYGLEPTRLHPDVMEADLDVDGIADRDDNCIDEANLAQSDVDHDGVGDVCDDCPLLANNQGSDFDSDGIGDFCDPHAVLKDCMLVVDAFVVDVTTSWIVEGEGTVEHAVNSAHFFPASTKSLSITSRDTPGDVDIQVLGNAPRSISFSAGTVYDQATTPLACKLLYIMGGTSTIQLDGPSPVLVPSPKEMTPTNPLNHQLYLRMQVADLAAPTVNPVIGCRIDFGISVGLEKNAFAGMIGGAVRLKAEQGEIDVNAVMYTRLVAGTPCPPTTFR
jgi:hypothetical protein